jgi:hypothetical protein
VEDESRGSGASPNRSIVAFLPTSGATVVATEANGLDSLADLIKICVTVLLRDSPIIFFKSEDHSAPRSKADDSILGGGTG